VNVFATLEEVGQRLDWQLDPDEQRIAAAALIDASDEARVHGRDWNPATAPRLVKMLVLKAVVRYLRNPDGYTSSRAGDETLTWSDRGDANAGAVSFTRDEITLLRELAGRRAGLTSAPIFAWSPLTHRRGPGHVPVDGGGDPFPLFPTEDGPW
jgi:hypothetical protein